jgi:CRISPR-associated protein Csx17
MPEVLKVVPCEGVRPDSLGNYLVGLGLLAATSTRWPEIRGCWRSGHFLLLPPQATDGEALEKFLLREWEPTPYQPWWLDKQKMDTKTKSDRRVWEARNVEDLGRVRLLDAHIVGVGRNQFNPIFGSGGNIGKRKLSKVFADARKLLQSANEEDRGGWVRMTLWGHATGVAPPLNSAGTWFVYANKTFNSGQGWYREGELSPWSFLLALEGALLLVGAAGRRLGSKARPYAVFPFISEPLSPGSGGEVGLTKAEFWAPLWQHPATITELRALLERGLARVGQRAAGAAHEFALAARTAGVDAGIKEFARFALRQTTSSKVYEAIPQERVAVNVGGANESSLILPLIPWLNRLPYEPRDGGQRGKFKGLRGPIEKAVVELASRPEETELWRKLLMLLAYTQTRIDLNKDLRDRCRALPLLGMEWFERAWHTPPDEISVARAIASVGADTDMPLQVNVFGVEVENGTRFAKNGRPQRAVWNAGDPVRVLAEVVHRRLVDTPAEDDPRLGGRCTCPARMVSAFLNGVLDGEEVCRWVPALSLIDWRSGRPQAGTPHEDGALPAEGTYLLYCLFRPLFHPETIRVYGEKLFPDGLAPRTVTATRLLNLIRQGDWGEATALADSRYLAAGRSINAPPKGVETDGERLAAAMLIPVSTQAVAAGLRRWLQPTKRAGFI